MPGIHERLDVSSKHPLPSKRGVIATRGSAKDGALGMHLSASVAGSVEQPPDSLSDRSRIFMNLGGEVGHAATSIFILRPSFAAIGATGTTILPPILIV